MRFPVFLLALFILVTATPATAQKRKKKRKKVNIENINIPDFFASLPPRLKDHIMILASDSLEGRRTGTRGEQMAADYISRRFAEAGIAPAGDNNTWLQWFEVNEGKQFENGSSCTINEKKLVAGKDYFPYSTSASGKVEALVSPVLKEAGMPWFLDLKEVLEQNKQNPHYDVNNYITQKTAEFEQKKATVVIVYNSSKLNDNLVFDAKAHPATLSIPVIYIGKEAAAQYLKKESEPVDLKLNLVIADKKKRGSNIVGFIDNQAANTVIIGAHFDHLGYGEDHNSLYTGATPQVHNGADDNASGTASLIELARLLKQKGSVKFNYTVIAFSGEELGLYGSKHYAENPAADFSKVDYMINMDMVGRLNDSTKALTIGGYGTSPAWSEVMGSITTPLTLKFDSSGTGPSDHTSFYRKNIPVLFFFTGTHSDYHKPGDDAEKINYNGTASIVKLIYAIIEKTADRDKLAFSKTREVSPGSSTRFTVSLGIMPDYTYSGNGVRVDGVSEGKLAQKLGLLAGDVVVQLGEFKVASVENYMQVLSKFKKGDATKLTIKRGEKEMVYDVNF
jgi:aminopeptidase YwaD